MKNNSFIFGPILSRRLGVSLGLDLIPYKTCSYDCVYCECGKTNNLSTDFISYLNPDLVFKELRKKLSTIDKIDYITFSGSGEPTLNIDFPYYVKTLKKDFKAYKIALLTNTSTIVYEQIYKASLMVDLYVPSMDAVILNSFNKINRPHSNINLALLKEKLIEFSKEYKNKFYLEIFLAKGLNDTKEDIKELANYISKLKYSKVQINTIDRPGTETNVYNIDEKTIDLIRKYFKNINYEYVSRANKQDLKYKLKDLNVKQEILSGLYKRALRLEDILSLYDLEKDTLKALLQSLIDDNKIVEFKQNSVIFYKAR